jgi:transcriptional regulator with XRE-family HTH domain
MRLGNNILKLSRKLNLNQRELAKLVGVTETTMSRYINGTREPNLETLSKLVEVLQTTIDDLVGVQETNVRQTEYPQIKRLVARNANNMSLSQKTEIINVLLSEE